MRTSFVGISLFAALSLIACQAVVLSDARAESSQELAAADPDEAYQKLKVVVRELYVEGDLFAYGDNEEVDTVFDTCLRYDPTSRPPALAGGDPLLMGFETVAEYAVFRERGLRAAGYPEAAWLEPLNANEQSLLDLLKSGISPPLENGQTVTLGVSASQIYTNFDQLDRELAQQLEDYRTKKNPTLPALPVPEIACSQPVFVELNVETDPQNGQVWLITKLEHRYCEELGIDPNDTTACDYWREALPGLPLVVAGGYKYRAVWPDGTTRNSTIQVDPGTDILGSANYEYVDMANARYRFTIDKAQ